MNQRKSEGPAETPPSFEEALARLERIVQDLEGSELSLEETLARYEEGSRLVKECARRLEEAEQRIRVLSAPQAEESGAAEENSAQEKGEDEGTEDADGLPF